MKLPVWIRAGTGSSYYRFQPLKNPAAGALLLFQASRRFPRWIKASVAAEGSARFVRRRLLPLPTRWPSIWELSKQSIAIGWTTSLLYNGWNFRTAGGIERQ